MITQLEIITPRVITSPLPVTEGTEATDPIQIHNIDGLGPVAATVNTTQYGSVDDEFYTGSVVGKRNIVITVGLNPNWADQSIEGLRQVLYAYFMPKKAVTLKFTSTHMPPVTIDGIVESFEPNMFAKDPEIQVSIICPKAAFIAVDPTSVSNQSVAIPDGDPTLITYQGTIPTGFVVELTQLAGNADYDGQFRIINELVDVEEMIASGLIDASHSIEVSTVTGNKYIRQIPLPSGISTSLMGSFGPGGAWPQLDEGLNKFRIATTWPVTWTMTYYAKYGGI